MPRKPKSDYAILTVTNALRLLEAFYDREEIGVADLSRHLDLHKNNVFRLLATLEQAGYIEQSKTTDRYRLGVRCHLLGQAYARGYGLLARARELLARLVAETGETAHLAMLDPELFRVVHLDGEAPLRQLAAALRVGRTAPLHCTALGKALLGCAPERSWRDYDEKVVGGGPLPAHGPRTIEDPAKFFEALRAVATSGCAYDVEELEEGLACVAAPVHTGDGSVGAALSISAPLFRHGEEGLRDGLRGCVVRAAAELSAALGYPGEETPAS